MKVASLLPLLLLTGCLGGWPVAPSDDYIVYIDPAFDAPGSQYTSNDVKSALNDWLALVPQLRLLYMVEDVTCGMSCYHAFSIRSSTAADVVAQRGEGKTGYTHYQGLAGLNTQGDWANIVIANDLPNRDEWRDVMRHEIGHALGLQHVEDWSGYGGGTAVMHASYSGGQGRWLGCWDLWQYEDVRGQVWSACN